MIKKHQNWDQFWNVYQAMFDNEAPWWNCLACVWQWGCSDMTNKAEVTIRRMVELGCGGRFCIKQAEALRKHEGSNLLTATYSGQAWEQASHFGPLLRLCCCCIAIKKCKRQQGSKYVMESSQLVSPSRFSVLNLANCVGFKALSTLSWICVAVPILYTCQAHSVEDMW